MNRRPNTTTNIDLPTFIQEVKDKGTTVLSGTNNCGKSYLLRAINRSLGHKAHYLSCQRFYNIQQFYSRLKSENEEQQHYANFLNMYNQSQNFDHSTTDLNTSLTGLNQKQLDLVFQLCSELIGEEFKIVRVMEDYPFSPFYISVNGYNMSYSSSGTRPRPNSSVTNRHIA